jgi:DNA-binding protein YbaB
MNSRANRSKNARREHIPNPEKHRNRSLQMTPEGVLSRGQEKDIITDFGRKRVIYRGEYEIFTESLAPRVCLGSLKNETGTLTVFVHFGTLFLGLQGENVTPGVLRIRAGEHINLTSNMEYTISTGEVPVTLMRVQTKGYDETVKLLSERIVSTNAEGTLIMEDGRAEVDHVSPEGARVVRASYSAEHRKHVADQLKSDNAMKFSTSGHTRKEREAKQSRRSAAEATPHAGQTFVDPTAPGDQPVSHLAINPQALQEAEIAALQSIGMRAGE